MECIDIKPSMVYIVDFCDSGIDKAYSTLEAAKDYARDTYIKDLTELRWGSMSTSEVIETIQQDLIQIDTKGQIDDYVYIYSLPLE